MEFPFSSVMNTQIKLLLNFLSCYGMWRKSINHNPQEEIDENRNYWRNSLVGYFIGARLAFFALKQRVLQMWIIKGTMELFYITF